MTTLPSTTETLHPDHDALVERTLALLPARRDHSTPARGFIPPADLDTYRSLLDRIDEVREGALVGSDARARIMHEAGSLGIRPFDASMMIALAQDRARRGESNADIPFLLRARPTPGAPGRPQVPAAVRPDTLTWIGVALGGLLIAGLIAGWFAG